MDMRIQYGDMNVYRELPNAVATGLGLGMQYRKQRQQEQKENAPNITIPDPGQRQQVDTKALLGQEMNDISRWKEYQQKAKGLSDPDLQELWDSMKMKGLFQSSIIANSIGIKDVDPKEYEQTIKKIVTNDPTAEFDLKILKGKLGEGSEAAKAIDTKIAQVRQEQKKLDEEYDIKLKDTLSFVLDFQNDPRKYSNKGITPEQVKKMVDASGDHLVELWKNPANREWVNDWLSVKNSIMRKSGGGNLREKSFVTYDKQGTRQVFSAMDVNDARMIAKQKGWDQTKIRDMGKEGDFVSDIAQGSIVKRENLPRVKAGDGWTDKNGKAITEVIADGKHEFADKDGVRWTVIMDGKKPKYNRVK